MFYLNIARNYENFQDCFLTKEEKTDTYERLKEDFKDIVTLEREKMKEQAEIQRNK